MLETLALTLRDSLELAILSGLLFGFIYKIKRKELANYGYGGLALALLFSLLLVYSLNHLRIAKEIEIFLSFIGFILTIVMIGWSFYQSSKYRKISINGSRVQVESSLFSEIIIFLFTLYLGVKFETRLFLFPKEMAQSEMLTTGINTALLLQYFGGFLGILLGIVFAFTLVKSHKKLTIVGSRNLIVLIYFINLARLSILVFYGFIVKGVITATPRLISKLAPLYNNIERFFYILVGIIVISLLINLFKKERIPELKELNFAEARKIKAELKDKVFWAKAGVGVLLLCIALLGVNYIYANQEIELVPAIAVEPENGQFIVPKADLEDGEIHRYSYETERGTLIKFFLLKKTEDAYGVVYDACEICGVAGYYQRDDEVVCKRCDVVMNKMTINFPGGCNPIPLPYGVDQDSIKIRLEDLLEREDFFAK
ncbi:hypothetical protein U472_05265 [Orenia metallireducens]|uniref:Membrane iron-sulfur containing protein FtrD-like domain-containing protein n=1 Tax=Orenia metallireducens TaxID=1413210 RepID=A0A1C0A9C2_9FIRM|nr:Fe-S-containing protein [Orenia metallireducens]OCL26898.1 hypothetical protein U472_05265 [Orenia metallireducens]